MGRLIGCTKGDMNTKLHAVTDADSRQICVSAKTIYWTVFWSLNS